MDIVHLKRVEHDKNLCRFYRIAVVPTLFGEWALLREWGRIGSPGTVRESWFQTQTEAMTAGRRLMNQKIRKGYLACSKIALNDVQIGFVQGDGFDPLCEFQKNGPDVRRDRPIDLEPGPSEYRLRT